MLIISLVLAVIGLAALVFAVITSNELIAWVCIGASVLGVVLLIVDALQERRLRESGGAATAASTTDDAESDDDDDDTAAGHAAETREGVAVTSEENSDIEHNVGDEH